MLATQTADNRTERPSVPNLTETQPSTTDPKLALALPIIVTYRLFSKSQVRTKIFSVTDEGREQFRVFVESMRAHAILVDGSWKLISKGEVDYMTVGFLDPKIDAQLQARAKNSKQLIADWRKAQPWIA